MRKFEHKEEIVKVVTGYTCDICHEECGSAEFLEMKASWGYDSPWDLEKWEAHICVACTEYHLLTLIDFNKEPNKQWL